MQTVARMCRSHGPLAVLVLLYLALGGLYSVVTPIFEAPDEIWHFSYIRYIAQHNRLPVQGAGQGEEAARQEASQPPFYYLLAQPLMRLLDTQDFAEYSTLNPHAAPGLPHSDGNKNMVVHRASERFPYRGTVLAVHVVRGLSLALGVVTLLATYSLAVRLFPAKLAWVAAGLVACNPQFIFISASISNDNLMTALGSLGLALLVSMQADRPLRGQTRDMAALGVITGLAMLTKLTGLLLLAFVLAALMLDGRGGRLLTRARDCALVAVIAATLSGWWYVRNWLLYEDATGLGPMLEWVGERHLSVGELVSEIEGVVLSFWAVFGWFNILADEWVYVVLRLLMGLAAVGLVMLLIRQATRRPAVVTDMRGLALAAGWGVVVAFGLLRWTLTTQGSQGRLLFPAIGGIAVLMLAGLCALIPPRLRKVLLSALAVGLCALAVVCPFRYIGPAYAQPTTTSREQLAFRYPVFMRYGADEMELIGYNLEPAEVTPGAATTVILYLEALRPMEHDYSLFIHLWGRDMEWVGQRDSYPGRGTLPTSQWPAGMVIEDRYVVSIAPTATVPARVQIEIGMYDLATGRRLLNTDPSGKTPEIPIVGRMKVVPRTPLGQAPLPALASFAGRANLVDVRLEAPRQVAAGSVLTVTTTWQAVQAMTEDYTMLLHLLDERDGVAAQNDAQPQGGDYPTGLWHEGEVVVDQRTLTVPLALPPGNYRLATGLYVLNTEERLPASSERIPVSDDRAIIGQVVIR